jgi:hypothetical protein
MSLCEIEADTCRDLFATSRGDEDKTIREGAGGDVFVDGVTWAEPADKHEAMQMLLAGTLRRKTAVTAMNAESSRSHAILTVRVETTRQDAITGETVVRRALLHLVDLAGSERQRNAQTVGARFAEGVNINLSLTALGTVIMQLNEGGKQFVSYRSSKLTFLLRNSLGGNSNTAMICAISPTESNTQESKSTLDFARKARNVTNSVGTNVVSDERASHAQLVERVRELRRTLAVEREQAAREREQSEAQAAAQADTHATTERATCEMLALSTTKTQTLKSQLMELQEDLELKDEQILRLKMAAEVAAEEHREQQQQQQQQQQPLLSSSLSSSSTSNSTSNSTSSSSSTSLTSSSSEHSSSAELEAIYEANQVLEKDNEALAGFAGELQDKAAKSCRMLTHLLKRGTPRASSAVKRERRRQTMDVSSSKRLVGVDSLSSVGSDGEVGGCGAGGVDGGSSLFQQRMSEVVIEPLNEEEEEVVGGGEGGGAVTTPTASAAVDQGEGDESGLPEHSLTLTLTSDLHAAGENVSSALHSKVLSRAKSDAVRALIRRREESESAEFSAIELEVQRSAEMVKRIAQMEEERALSSNPSSVIVAKGTPSKSKASASSRAVNRADIENRTAVVGKNKDVENMVQRATSFVASPLRLLKNLSNTPTSTPTSTGKGRMTRSRTRSRTRSHSNHSNSSPVKKEVE